MRIAADNWVARHVLGASPPKL